MWITGDVRRATGDFNSIRLGIEFDHSMEALHGAVTGLRELVRKLEGKQ